MSLDALFARDDCVSCTSSPVCSCDTSSGQICVLINRSCTECSHFECQQQDNNSGTQVSGGGVSKGALAGAVVGTLIFLGIVIGLLFFYRRNNRLRKKETAAREGKPDVPAAAADVLNRPDPMEKTNSIHQSHSNTVRVYSTSSNTTIDLDPESQTPSHSGHRNSVRSNPFDDNHSIQTAGTEGTNVIPIALVSPETQSTVSHESDVARAASPARPPRSPDMGLNLDHVNVSRDSLRSPKADYARSQRSELSGVSSRNSYMSNASYSSDFLNEAPMIMTANKVVIGEGLKPPTSRPAVTSPLAATSFGPADVVREAEEGTEDGHNPFADKHSSTRTTLGTSAPSSPRSVTTFGQPSPGIVKVTHHSVQSDWESPEGSNISRGRNLDVSRPSSISTQAGSVIDIASVTRVNVGLSQLANGQSPRPAYRTTMGRLVTPPSNDKGTFEEQQQRALAHAQAQAQAQGFDKSRRTSGSSAISATADSILESFPFVPPSPISNRPVRSPPVSPLAQQSFSVEPPTPTKSDAKNMAQEADLPAPPNRRTLGLSTGSQLSTASSGLGSFPFQIDTGSSSESSSPSAFSGRQRASLDTLALTSDLSSYPLGFDRDSQMPPLRKN